MPLFSQLTRSIGSAIRSVFNAGKATQTRRPAPGKPVSGADSPGRFGPNRTVEVDPRNVGPVRMSYSPVLDGNPDPGEIVWTWVPYEENNGQGKDRPVLVVAAEKSGTLLVVQLTSKKHEGRSDFVSVGAGAWDGTASGVVRESGPGAACTSGRHAARGRRSGQDPVPDGHPRTTDPLRLALIHELAGCTQKPPDHTSGGSR